MFAVLLLLSSLIPFAAAQAAKQSIPESKISDPDADHVQLRSQWFYRGRLVRGKHAAELRHRAFEMKMQARRQRAAALLASRASSQNSSRATSQGAQQGTSQNIVTSGSWIPLGPMPLASDASGNGTQDYRQVAGRATAVAIDPADPTGNTIFIGGAQSGIWKSTNAASPTPANVTWTPVTDDAATLSIGSIAIQPGNSNPSSSVILAATGEANNSADSYFGLGILRSTDGGNSWALVNSANDGAISFSGLGGTRMAFSTVANNTVVSAMATSSEGLAAADLTPNTARGLYTSGDAGQSWNYDALVDPGGATDATSATSVVFNSSAGLFFAAVRYHGFYSSPDGVTWTRLPNQPGGTLLTAAQCPAQSASNGYSCPIYRAELTVVPTRNEMYAWFVYYSAGAMVDGGIWQSLNGGQTWTAISDSGITNCGDLDGCGVEQGFYNLELLAVPSGSATDLYAGAVNLYKCSINVQNPTCAAQPFMNLTHVYGCIPVAAPAHVHPDQHALAYMLPTTGTDSGNAVLYFANDGGIYRALDGFYGLTTGSCSGTNAFDDLNQNLGSMTQFVSFSQHPTDPKTLLGGTQDNGSPATAQATANTSWGNVLGGDGGYNAIDLPTNFYAANPDLPPGGLGVQSCPSGVACNNSKFNFVVTSTSVGGDDGDFYFPYTLDAQSTWAMLVGTCRIWRGPRTGGAFVALSPNFETLGSGTCSGSEVNLVSAIAAGGAFDSNGSKVIYAGTSGPGPLNSSSQAAPGGRVWVTTNATAGPSAFLEVTNNGPQGSINPNQFPISAIAIDSSDATGNTAYLTIMGFTGGPGHVWKTINAGTNWIDFTANLPDSPVNAVIVDGPGAEIYVGTDVGVFASSTTSASWAEMGPNPATNQYGFLPNVAVTALGLFNYGGNELLRASTYGRGIWQYNLIVTPTFQLSVPNAAQTVFAGQSATFSGTATALNGYTSSITLSCVAGTSAPPSICSISPATLTPASNTPFTLTAAGATGDYAFNLQAVGSDSKHVTQQTPIALHVINFGMTSPSPASVTVNRGTTSSPVDFQITAAGASFNQAVNVTCTISGATCNLAPGTTVYPTSSQPVSMTASVEVPASTAPGNYTVSLQATTAGAPAALNTSFSLVVTSNPTFTVTAPASFPEVNVGSTGTSAQISIAAFDGFAGTVSLACSQNYGAGSCSITPATVSLYPATAILTINGTSFSAGSYSLTVTGTSGALTSSAIVPFNVGDYAIAGKQSLLLAPGGQGTANLTFTSSNSYSGQINVTCDKSALSGSMCNLSPASPISLNANAAVNVVATINVPNTAAVGTYNINLNSQDTRGAPSHNFTITITVGQDFLVTSTTLSQTVNAGQTSGPYNLTVQPVGASFNGAVTLSCAGLPALSQCTFAPSAPVTPGNSATTVVLTITTTGTSASSDTSQRASRFRLPLYAGILMMPMLFVFAAADRRQRLATLLLLLFSLLLIMTACSGVSSGGSGGSGGGQGTSQRTPPGTYKITVTGTSPGTSPDAGQSTQVTLVVN